MKNFKNFETEIKKCSRCGLCQAVCPIFIITKNECTSPRGKFIMLNEFLKKGGKPAETLKKYINTCLFCKKCEEACPVKINICEIHSAFEKDFHFLKFKNLFSLVKLLFLVVKFNVFKFNSTNENYINTIKNKRIIYLKPYYQRDIPKIIKENNVKVFECGTTIKFRLNNPDLYNLLSKYIIKDIADYNSHFIITDSINSIWQFQNGLKLTNKNLNVYKF